MYVSTDQQNLMLQIWFVLFLSVILSLSDFHYSNYMIPLNKNFGSELL